MTSPTREQGRACHHRGSTFQQRDHRGNHDIEARLWEIAKMNASDVSKWSRDTTDM